MDEREQQLKRITFLYSLYSFLVIKFELFSNLYFKISDLRVIDQKVLNLFSDDCYRIVKNEENMFNEMEELMSTLNVTTSDEPQSLMELVNEEISLLSWITPEDFMPSSLPATKEDLQQFKRFTYKSFQEIQNLIDSNHTSSVMTAEIDRLKAEALEDQFKMAKSAVEMFNLFDRVRLTFGDDKGEISEQLISVINHSLVTLKEMGIDEIDVYGQDFDGDYMESLGTVSADEVSDDLQTYQVAVIFRKAFKFVGNGKIIQDAIVKTIL